MLIHAISDLHGHLPDLPGGDLLIIAGDLTYSGTKGELKMLDSWLGNLKYKEIVVIAGNHDTYLTLGGNPFKNAHYLINSGVKLFGLYIWGSPFTPKFGSWGFMKQRGEQMRAIWNQIPDHTDILVTHGPAHGILDKNNHEEHCGCLELRHVIDSIKPKYHFFGHIHESYGYHFEGETNFYNCAYCDENNEPKNKYMRILIKDNVQ